LEGETTRIRDRGILRAGGGCANSTMTATAGN
jgi:hypothetical protein